jgi:hypothetical protein
VPNASAGTYACARDPQARRPSGGLGHAATRRCQSSPLWNRPVDWSTGCVSERPRLPKGWSFPIKPSEVERYFPGVGYVYWVRGTAKLKDWSARDQSFLYLAWQPRTAMPASILTVGAVPSEFRAEIRQWVDEVVGPEASAWMKALESKSPTWLDSGHRVNWKWRRDPNSDRPSTVA